MTEQGKITDINGEEIILSCSSLSGGCQKCKASSFCSTDGKIFSAINGIDIDLKQGDTVEIYMPTGQTIFAGFMVLIFPLLSFILFFITGSWLSNGSEGLGILSGILGLAAGFGITFYYNKINKRKNTPRITRLLHKE
ncbi:MAG: SoxR reducing system RseC family protein [Spirochaetota bacterium]|nr:SoxR reducing system RseC family protein [Spirochaetota bacterium]